MLPAVTLTLCGVLATIRAVAQGEEQRVVLEDPGHRQSSPANAREEAVEFIRDPRAEAHRDRLHQQLREYRREIAAYEARYAMSLDEFCAELARGPEMPGYEDYLDWSRVVEECRRTEAALARTEAQLVRPVVSVGHREREGTRND